MWEMYDKLIEEIPEELLVDDFVTSRHFCCLKSGDLVGIAFSMPEGSRPSELPNGPVGLPLKVVAQKAKSWNFMDAGIGMAAINAFYNDRKRLTSMGISIPDGDGITLAQRKEKNPIGNNADKLLGKKVALIGHFRNVEKKLGDIADLYILERKPSEGDYPDSACEYLLPEMDYILATGVTLINKTAKRLFELKGSGSWFTLMGPTTTLSPTLFRYGVDSLAGFVVTDPDYVWDVIVRDAGGMFSGGVMVDLTREDFRLWQPERQ